MLGLAALGLAFAGLFTLARRLHARLERTGGARRFTVVLAIAVAMLVPAAGALATLSDRLREKRLARRVALVEPVIDAVARGAMGPFGRADFAGSLFRLLRGEDVKRSPTVRYRPVELRRSGGERRSAEEDLPFVVHERTLRRDESLRYAIETAAPIDRIAVAIPAADAATAPSMEVVVAGPGATRRRLSLVAGGRRLHAWGSDASRVEVHVVPLFPEVAGATSIELRAGVDGQRVAGLCVVGARGASALVPEERTRTGLPILAGGDSRGAGIAVRPGDRPLELAFDPPMQCDRLWLVYAASDPRAADYRWFREDVLEVRLEYDDGAPPGRLLLCHGVDVHSANLDRSRHADDFECSVASTWEADGVRWHADERGWSLGGTHRLKRLVLRNRSGESGYALDLLGVTVGSTLPDTPGAGFGPAVQLVGEGIRTANPLREPLEGVHFAFADHRGVIRAVDGEDGHRLVGAALDEGDLHGVALGRARPARCAAIAGVDADVAVLPIRDGETAIGALVAFVPETDRAARRERFAFLPLAALLISLPYFLVAFAESLARGERIRRKIAIALAAASAVPVGALFLAVPGAFGRARTDATVRRLHAELDTVRERLVRQRDEAAAEAASFIQRLQEHPRAAQLFLDPSLPNLDDALRREIRQARDRHFGRTPAFVRLELRLPGSTGSPWKTIDVHDPGFSPEGIDLQASDFYRVRDRLAAVGVDRRVDGDRRIRCIVGREVMPALQRGRDARFFGLDGTALDARALPAETGRAPLADAVAAAIRTNQPSPVPGGAFGVVDAFRDREGNPLFAVGVFEPEARGDVVLLGFHASLGSLLGGVAVLGAISALALSRILTERLTGPIERLAAAAEEARRGRSVASIAGGTTDEVGVLSERFQAMSSEVQRRVERLSDLQRGILAFAARLDRHDVAREASRFVAESSGARSAMLLLPDAGGRGWRAHLSNGASRSVRLTPLVERIVAANRWALLADDGPSPFEFLAPADRRLLEGAGAVLGGPVRLGDREEGWIAAFFHRAPDASQRGALYTAAGAVAIALENARMHGIAIEDAPSGALVGHYFRQRLEEAIERAQALRQPLWLARVQLDAPAEGRAGGVDRVLRALVRRIHRAAVGRAGVFVGRTGPLEITVAAGELDPERRPRFERALRESAQRLAAGADVESRVRAAAYPADAPSAELLLARLRLEAPSAAAPTQPELVTFAGGDDTQSPAMRRTLERALRLAAVDLPVLLTGEPGVGKEWLARRMHASAFGESAPFVAVRLASLAESLVDAELMGVEKGAYSGATSSRPGLFEQANGGTLFLDEVAETPLEVQAKLLRVLEDRRVRRLGGRRETALQVRVIASSSVDLLESLTEGSFRADLYYRLSGVLLPVPALRERLVDVPALAVRFLAEAASVPGARWTPRALDRLIRHRWPGNLVELRAAVQRASLNAAGRRDVDAHDLELGNSATPEASPVRAESPSQRAVRRTEVREATTPAHAGADWNDRQRRLLSARRQGERITMREYVALTGVSSRTGLRDLLELARSGRLRKEGRKRGTTYRIV